MNKIVAVVVVGCSLVIPQGVRAGEDQTATAAAVLAEGLKVMKENGWTANDVADAIKSLRGLYVRDNATKDGRARWNGKIVKDAVDTNTLQRVTVYENGRTFVDRAYVRQSADAVRAANAKLVTVTTNGVPAALARARARRAAAINAGVVATNVTVTVGGVN